MKVAHFAHMKIIMTFCPLGNFSINIQRSQKVKFYVVTRIPKGKFKEFRSFLLVVLCCVGVKIFFWFSS